MFLFLREAPDYRSGSERAAPLPGLRFTEALRGANFWKLLFLVAMGAGALTALATHLTALLGDHGVSTTVAAATLATISFTNAGWQIVLGHILDRSRSPWLAAPFILIGIVGVLIIGASHHPSSILFGGFLAGIGTGTEYGLLPFCMPRYFGFRSYGVVYGWIYGATMLVSGVTPYLMDLIYEAAGSYHLAIALIGLALAACAALVASLPRYRFGAKVT
jgi:MFS family permease